MNWLMHFWEWIKTFPLPRTNYHLEWRNVTEPFYSCLVCNAQLPADDVYDEDGYRELH